MDVYTRTRALYSFRACHRLLSDLGQPPLKVLALLVEVPELLLDTDEDGVLYRKGIRARRHGDGGGL